MRKYFLAVYCVTVLFGSVGVAQDSSLSDTLAAESLKHSAHDLVAIGRTSKARAARLSATLEYAARIKPDDPQIRQLQAFVYESQKKADKLIEALEICMKKDPKDYQIASKWLTHKLLAQGRAPQRLEFAQNIVDDNSYSNEIRAFAALMLGMTFRGQGNGEEAVRNFQRAITLDPMLSASYMGLASVAPESATTLQAKGMLCSIYENSRNMQLVYSFAQVLQTFGVAEQAAVLHEYIFKLTKKMAPDVKTDHNLLVQYCNVLLDAGQYNKAIETFNPLLEDHVTSVPLRSLLIEASRKVGDKQLEEKLVEEIELLFEQRKLTESQSPDFLTEIAMFYFFTMDDPKLAKEYTDQLALAGIITDEGRRVMSFLRLSDPETSQRAQTHLKEMMVKDPFSALFLAKFYYSTAAITKASECVKAGLNVSRGGQAGRQLKELAKKRNVNVPDPPGYDQFVRDVASFNKKYLSVGLDPEKHIVLEIKPDADEFAVDQPLTLKVSMKNVSDIPIIVGSNSLLPTSVVISVSPQGEKKIEFKDMIVTTLPAGRKLEPSESISKTVRVDVGPQRLWLRQNILQKVTLNVSAKLAHATGQAPLLEAVPQQIVRQGLFGDVDLNDTVAARQAYQQTLGLIVGMLQEKSLVYRISAAKRIGWLIVMYDAAKTRKIKISRELMKSFNRKLLIRLVQECLKDPSPAVRAEIISQLVDVRMDKLLMSQLSGSVNDQSPLVRLRLVELLGTTNLGGQTSLLEKFAKDDPDDLVRELASHMLKYDYSPRRTN